MARIESKVQRGNNAKIFVGITIVAEASRSTLPAENH